MENSYQSLNPEVNLLDDMDIHLVQANTGKRFANLLIDMVAFYVIFFFLAYILPAFGALFFIPLVPAIIFGLYMSFLELVLKGKTLGKLVTGTRAVQEDGSPITSGMAFQRGFSRLVPFEAFSALGSPAYPWHDRWSHTYVIDEKESRL
jgi:uncharacterized RDD family membrane protein YckC